MSDNPERFLKLNDLLQEALNEHTFTDLRGLGNQEPSAFSVRESIDNLIVVYAVMIDLVNGLENAMAQVTPTDTVEDLATLIRQGITTARLQAVQLTEDALWPSIQLVLLYLNASNRFDPHFISMLAKIGDNTKKKGE